jgi:hypothetical protein
MKAAYKYGAVRALLQIPLTNHNSIVPAKAKAVAHNGIDEVWYCLTGNDGQCGGYQRINVYRIDGRRYHLCCYVNTPMAPAAPSR